jgi:hypothetical protein
MASTGKAPPPTWIVRLILWLHRSLIRAARRLLPPEAHAFELATGVARTRVLDSFVRHGLPDRIGDAPRSAQDLAAEANLDPGALHRMLRVLAFDGVVDMAPDGRVRANRVTRALRRDATVEMWAFVRYFATDANTAAWGALDHALHTGESAFPFVHGRSVWAWLQEHPDNQEWFTRAMTSLTLQTAPAIAAAFPFGQLKRICDVGGGAGGLLAEVLSRHPAVQGVLCDAEPVLDLAHRHLAARGVLARCELKATDFFRAVPGGCDAYMLKNVLHDWDDARCVEILRVVRAAAQPGTRLIVVEERQEYGIPTLTSQVDLQMLVATDGGRERSTSEMRRLFEEANFRFDGVHPTASMMSLFVGTAH